MILLQLFWSFFQIGILSFGGGYAALPLIQTQVVNIHGWMTMKEFVDIITISQMTPGPIALNSATFVGIRIADIPGALIATLGCIVPSCIIVLLLAYFYKKYRELNLVKRVLAGLRPAVVALIASAGMSIVLLTFWGNNPVSFDPSTIDWISAALFAVCLFVLRKFKPNPILVMLGAGVVGFFLFFLI